MPCRERAMRGRGWIAGGRARGVFVGAGRRDHEESWVVGARARDGFISAGEKDHEGVGRWRAREGDI